MPSIIMFFIIMETKYETESYLNLCLHSDPTQDEMNELAVLIVH